MCACACVRARVCTRACDVCLLHIGASETEAAENRRRWAALEAWHTANQTPDSILLGQPTTIAPGLELRSPLLPWDEMWNVLKQFATEPESACTETDVAAVPCRSRRADRESISKSLSAAVLNAVTDGDYTDADRHIAMLKDGNGYVEANLDTHGMCFFIRLSHHEGEFAVGLGRRTFDAALDNPSEKLYEIEWYERKSKSRSSWGLQPAFKWTVGGYIGVQQEAQAISPHIH